MSRRDRCPWCGFPPDEHTDIRPGHAHWTYRCKNAPAKWVGVFVDRPVERPVIERRNDHVRALRLTWKDAAYPHWTRRVRWYEGRDAYPHRLAFEDRHRSCNRFYATREDAQHDWDLFVDEGASVKLIIEKGRGQ